MKTFFCGIPNPHNGAKVPAAFISVHALKRRKSGFPVHDWVMDSGAFTTIDKHGGYPAPPEEYAAKIQRWSANGGLVTAVSQDYMCERYMCARVLGLPVDSLRLIKKAKEREAALRAMLPDDAWRAQILVHQRLTIERYDELVAMDTGGVPIMPVLQGYDPAEYVSHIRQYGTRLAYGAWVGVGSVCKRNGSPRLIEAVLQAIKTERPDLRLHGFGVKTTALRCEAVTDLLETADSMAWSYSARKQGRGANDWREAVNFVKKVEAILKGDGPKQYELKLAA